MRDSNIVTQLRVITDTLLLGNFRQLAATTASAADEIERLRNERNAFEAERDELISISNKLKRERDEARREILESIHPDDRRAYAEARGWDCFKEER